MVLPQDCGASRDWNRLAQVFVEACRNPGSNRLLLKECADALVKEDVVTSVDAFLHHLYRHGEREYAWYPPTNGAHCSQCWGENYS